MPIATERLHLRPPLVDDAAFIHRLLNEPSFLLNIGDRGVHNLDDAGRYIAEKVAELQLTGGRGMYLVELTETRVPIGTCGLLKREALDDVDLGFAFLPEFWGKGYAREAAAAVMAHGRSMLGLSRLLAIVNPGNERSANLLERLGFEFEGMVRLGVEQEQLRLYGNG